MRFIKVEKKKKNHTHILTTSQFALEKTNSSGKPPKPQLAPGIHYSLICPFSRDLEVTKGKAALS